MEDIQNKNKNNNQKSNPGISRNGGINRYNRRHKRNQRPQLPAISQNSQKQPLVDLPDDINEEINDSPRVELNPISIDSSSSENIELPESNNLSEQSTPEEIPTFKIPDLSAYDADIDKPIPQVMENEADSVEVIGIRFKHAGKVYYFAPGGITVQRGDPAIVETTRGPEFGEVWITNRRVSGKDIVLPLRPLIRLATKEDIEHNEQNRKKEKEAFGICIEKIARHGLDMKLVDAQYTFDNSKLLFYFTSAGRVDFRELVKDLASVFRTRIELRQIGIRDEAKLLGGLGACGRSLCCSSFLSDFMQVSIKMAKEQSLSLNSNKISGSCGRLMCCLRYEYDTYVEEIKLTPPIDSVVRTSDGDGVVIEIYPLAGTVKVRFTDKQDPPVKTYNRADIKVLSRPQINDRDKDKEKNGADVE